MNSPMNGQCECGATQFNIHGKPLMRGYCHCTVCQEFNEGPYADVTFFRESDIDMPAEGQVDYSTYKSPPAVMRGKCHQCGKPAIEYVHLPMMPKVAIVPSANIKDSALLPDPGMHVFYHRRVADINDRLPKYSGFMRSQLMFMWQLIKGLRKSS